MRGLVLWMLVVLPSIAVAGPTPTEPEARVAHAKPAVGALVHRAGGRVATLGTAVLVGCRHAAVAREPVVDVLDPRDLELFFPHVGRFPVRKVALLSDAAPAPGLALVETITPIVGLALPRLRERTSPGTPAQIVGFGRSGVAAGLPGLGRSVGAAVRECDAAPEAAGPVCWEAVATDVVEPMARAPIDRQGALFVDGHLAGVTAMGGGAARVDAHLPMWRDRAFLAEILGDDLGRDRCGDLPLAGTAAAPATEWRGALSVRQPHGEHEAEVAAGTARLVVTLNAVDGSDYDLFVRRGAPPDRATFDCSSRSDGSYEACVIDDPAPGSWHVLVARNQGTGRYQLTATSFAPPCADPARAGAACDDGNPCTEADRCAGGRCVGQPVAAAMPCDDGNACTHADTCRGGRCEGATSCGDGVVQRACEECDDGNQVAGDGCEPTCRMSRTDAYVAYAVREARIPNNRLPRDWNLELDDMRIDDAVDDPENFTASRATHIWMPAATDLEAAPSEPGLAFVRYRLEGAREGMGAPQGGRYPRAVKHRPRTWKVATDDGSVVLQSAAVAALLVAARTGKAEMPESVGSGDAFVCYTVRVARRRDSEMAPDGRFRRDLQRFLADGFRDCSRGSGEGGFAGTGAAGKCLYDLQKPVELCNPVSLGAVAAPRRSAARVPMVRSSNASSLLCYGARKAARVRSDAVGEVLGKRNGAVIEPRQAAHRKRLSSAERPLYVQPGNGFPAPKQVDTVREEMVCVPAVAEVEE